MMTYFGTFARYYTKVDIVLYDEKHFLFAFTYYTNIVWSR